MTNKLIRFFIFCFMLFGLFFAGSPYTHAQILADTEWELNEAAGNRPAWFTPGSIRGFDIGSFNGDARIYIPSRGDKVRVLDPADGSEITLTTEFDISGIDGGTITWNDLEFSDDGYMFIGNLTSGGELEVRFKLYIWDEEGGEPWRVVELPTAEGHRVGDKFRVLGSMSDNSVEIWASVASSTPGLIYVFTTEDQGETWDLELIELSGANTSMPANSAVEPFGLGRDTDFYITGNGATPRRYNSDGEFIADSGLPGTGGRNGMEYFHYEGRDYLAVYTYTIPGNENRTGRIFIYDITVADAPELVVETPLLGPDADTFSSIHGKPLIRYDGDGEFTVFALDGVNGFGAYSFSLEDEPEIGNFALLFPPDGFELLVEGDPDNQVLITWEEADLNVQGDLQYTWHLDVRGGDFSDPIVSIPADNDGNANEITLTLGTIDDLLDANGVNVGDVLAADWTVTAEFGGLVQFADAAFEIDLERGVVQVEPAFTISEIPFTEDFEDVTVPNLPDGWSAIGNVVTFDGITTIGGTTLEYPTGIAGDDHRIAILPEIDAGIDITTLALSLNAYSTPVVGATIEVGFMSDPADPATFTLVETIVLPAEGVVTEEVISLAAYTDGDGRRIALKADSPSNLTRTFVGEVSLDEAEEEPEIGNFALLFPPDGFQLSVEGDPDNQVLITWEEADLNVEGEVQYTWHLDLRGGDFDPPVVSIPADNDGSATQITLTLGSIDDLLDANGVDVGDVLEADWTVTAEFDDLVQFADEPFEIDLERGVVAELFTVTFNVDMSLADDFNPEDDDVYISGSFIGWDQPGTNPDALMVPVDEGSDTYTISLQLAADNYAYKYFLVDDGPTWDGGEWDGFPDRLIEVTKDTTFFDLFGVEPDEDAIGAFALLTPADGTLLLVEGEPDAEVLITWERPVSTDDIAMQFTWHLDVRGGDFDPTIVSIPADAGGNANQITLTLGAIDDLLDANGVDVGDVLEADWTVTAELGDFVQFADDPFGIDLERGVVEEAAPEELIVDGNAGWRMMSAPVAGATVADIAGQNQVQGFAGLVDFYDGQISSAIETASPNLFLGYDGAGWTPANALTNELESGRGFIWYMYNNDLGVSVPLPFTLTLEGSGPDVDVTVPLHSDGNGFNLLGNPFSSGLDLSELEEWDGSDGLDNFVFQVWQNDEPGEGGGHQGSWQLFGPGQGEGRTILASWQGFMVENDDATELVIPEEARNPGGTFLKETAPVVKHLALTLDGKNDEAGIRTRDRANLVFSDQADDGWDMLDASQLTPLSTSFATLSFVGERNGETILKSQESRPADFEGTLELPASLGTRNMSGDMTITWEGLADLPTEWQFTLVDNETGASVDMRSAASYEFRIEGAIEKRQLEADVTIPEIAPMTAGDELQPRFTVIISSEPVSTETPSDLPDQLELAQNYPNPFNPTTLISYALPEQTHVRLTVYDMLGRTVSVLVDDVQAPGSYRVNWDATGVTSGVYIYRLTAEGQTLTRSMTLVK